MITSEALKKLVERARKDPRFFHALVFDPEKAIESVDFLDRKAKAALLAVNPESIISGLVGRLQWCGNTCGDSSCINTCGAHSCDDTCADSCGDTCSWSCGHTSNVFRGGASAAGVASVAAAVRAKKK